MCPCNQVESDRATVLDVKKVLEVRCGIPTYQQSLVMAGRALAGILTRLVDPSPLSCCGRIVLPPLAIVIAVAEVFPQTLKLPNYMYLKKSINLPPLCLC